MCQIYYHCTARYKAQTSYKKALAWYGSLDLHPTFADSMTDRQPPSEQVLHFQEHYLSSRLSTARKAKYRSRAKEDQSCSRRPVRFRYQSECTIMQQTMFGRFYGTGKTGKRSCRVVGGALLRFMICIAKVGCWKSLVGLSMPPFNDTSSLILFLILEDGSWQAVRSRKVALNPDCLRLQASTMTLRLRTHHRTIREIFRERFRPSVAGHEPSCRVHGPRSIGDGQLCLPRSAYQELSSCVT